MLDKSTIIAQTPSRPVISQYGTKPHSNLNASAVLSMDKAEVSSMAVTAEGDLIPA